MCDMCGITLGVWPFDVTCTKHTHTHTQTHTRTHIHTHMCTYIYPYINICHVMMLHYVIYMITHSSCDEHHIVYMYNTIIYIYMCNVIIYESSSCDTDCCIRVCVYIIRLYIIHSRHSSCDIHSYDDVYVTLSCITCIYTRDVHD